MRMGSSDYFEDDEFQEILDEYERTVQAGQTVFMDADDLADIADYYLMNDRSDEADEAIKRAIELEPDSPIVLSFLIHQTLNEKNYQAAEEYLSQITDHQHPEYIYNRAEIWIAQGMVDEADKHLRACLHEVSQEEYSDYVYDVVKLYSDYNCNNKAMEWIVRMPPQDTDELKELIGRTHVGMGQYDEAERIFNELIDKNPFQKSYWKDMVELYYAKEDYASALTSCEYAIALAPEDRETLLYKANIHYQMADYEQALEYYYRCQEKKEDESILLNQGSCFVNMGHYTTAERRLLKAEKIAPADSPFLPEIYQELAYIYGELGELDKALNYIDKALPYGRDNEHKAEILIIRGHILLVNHKVEEAMAAFQKGIVESGYSTYIQLRAIVSIYDSHYLDVAYTMFKQFFDLEGSDSNEGYSFMALCCYDMEKYDEYLQYLQKACQLNPKEAEKVLGRKFPKDLKPEDYYEYAKKNMKK